MGDTELIISVSWVNRSHISAESRPQSVTMARIWNGLFRESLAHALIWTTSAILNSGRRQSLKERKKCVMNMGTTKSAVATGRFLEISALAAYS